ncbi:MAG: prepilin-type N-terminal cleavage/methylation domain-containing protein [Thiotrichaceae bacterium]|nr:prepilin-type N-terminal cleavage/methylation domain-containing protein [Thiotrichaceae bacterium]
MLIVKNKHLKGYTLIEIIIVIAILGIIAAIAIPSYQSYVLKSKRSVAKNILLDVASRELSYRTDNKTYGDLSDLYGGTDKKYINDKVEISDASANSLYSFEVSNISNTTYTITATYTSDSGQNKDIDCKSFIVTHDGVKTAINSSNATESSCW